MQMKGVTPHAILKETDQIYAGKYQLVIRILGEDAVMWYKKYWCVCFLFTFII